MNRYARQILLPEIGEKGQRVLENSRVLVIGAGGLGSPVLTYLAEAGIGHIEILDMDTVSLSNLNRQFLFTEKDIDSYKAHVAERVIGSLNQHIIVHGQAKKITAENIYSCIEGFDIVVDCVDSIKIREIVHNACLEKNIPLIEAGVEAFYGFVTTIKKGFPCLQCMGYFKGKDKEQIPTLGAVVGIIGAMQATEVIKVLLGIEGVLYGKMLYYDAKRQEIDCIQIPENSMCSIHKE